MTVSMKDSGVEWLGEVPAHWDIVPPTALFTESKERARDNDQILSATQKYGVIPLAEFEALEQRQVTKASANLEMRKHVEIGDFVISMRSMDGGLERAHAVGSVRSSYSVLKAGPDVDGRFFGLLLKSSLYIQALRLTSSFIRDGQDLNFSHVRKVKLPKLGRKEQSAIADHIGRATTRIDALVAKKTRFIELLREKRQVLITHAVTKGLDADVPTKDSGVEWLGDVPAHWKIPALKRLVSSPITDGPHETPIKTDFGIRFISAEAVSSGRIDFTKAWGMISKEDDARFSKKYKPETNDIYMIKSGATTGVAAIVEDDINFNIWSPLAAIRPNGEVLPHFLLYALRSSEFQAGIAMNWSYGTQQNIGMRVLEQLPVPTPPLLDEQRKIVAHLDRATTRIDTLIAKTERSIELLREHRTALITAAVTGKIDLRNAA